MNEEIFLAEQSPSIAVVGSGPAGLIAAAVLASSGCRVTLFEKRSNISRKLFIAGTSGLNIASSLSGPELVGQYSGPSILWEMALKHFSPSHWLQFISFLGLQWFKGTSARYFVKPMNAAPLVRAWRKYLNERAVHIIPDRECRGFELRESPGGRVLLHFSEHESISFAAACFALGGASYEEIDQLPKWPEIFAAHGVAFSEFVAANVGFETPWKEGLLKEAEGKPLKNIVLRTNKGLRAGELMITHYGLEGTPVYEVGIEGLAHIDLKPDLSVEQVIAKMNQSKENLSPIRRAKKYLSLSTASHAIIYHHASKESLEQVDSLARLIKAFPISLVRRRPLTEAISSSGGLGFSEVDAALMLKSRPGVFVAGEMLDWSAPTGGFLIQGCVSQGFLAAAGILKFLGKPLPQSAFWLQNTSQIE